jgi:hypothetical protein
MIKKSFVRNCYLRVIQETKKKNALKKIPTIKILTEKNSPQYVVSLTSYGKRLIDTAPYAIISLFNQTIQPDKIILWIGEKDKENVGETLTRLQKLGLEIRYCEDLRSYTKLFYSLKEFSDACIITADDDVYYPQNWLGQLIAEHNKHPRKIICHRAHGIKVDENHCVLPYFEWDWRITSQAYFENNNVTFFSIFPTGVGGILYPPNSLDKQVLSKALFMELAPYADDIWFWAMAQIHKEYFGEESPYIVVENGYSGKLQHVDNSQRRNGNSLLNGNFAENRNDKQLKAVINYFPQLQEMLSKIRRT